MALLRHAAGVRVALSSDYHTACPRIAAGEGLLLEQLGAALLDGDPDQIRALMRRHHEGALVLEPERYVRASELGCATSGDGLPLADAEVTWGLQAMRLPSSPYRGRGIRVAILDTGLDLSHPDFAGRTVVAPHRTAQHIPAAGGSGSRCRRGSGAGTPITQETDARRSFRFMSLNDGGVQ